MVSLFDVPIADPEFAYSLPLLSSAWPVTLIQLGYLLFVLKIGKMFMEHRQPYNLAKIIRIYNIFQMIYNALLCYSGIHIIFIRPLNDIRCMVTLPLDHPDKYIDRYISYAYYINKILDLLDTVFFVLRKSYKQITVLHVYHHIMMVSSTYWVLRLSGAGGQYKVMGTLNTFVHTVMYFYYFTSAMYPNLKGSLWWKKYITKIQIIQFLILIAQSVTMLIFNPDCEFPLLLQYMQLFQASVMVYMFSKFYYSSYIKPKPLKKS